MKALGGCFGMAGIVTFITLRMDVMTYARYICVSEKDRQKETKLIKIRIGK